jgi:hypothetical protein
MFLTAGDRFSQLSSTGMVHTASREEPHVLAGVAVSHPMSGTFDRPTRFSPGSPVPSVPIGHQHERQAMHGLLRFRALVPFHLTSRGTARGLQPVDTAVRRLSDQAYQQIMG